MNWTCLSINGGSLNFASTYTVYFTLPRLGYFVEYRWGGGGGFTPPSPYDFALRVEIGEFDTCPQSNFSRPAHLKNRPLSLMGVWEDFKKVQKV